MTFGSLIDEFLFDCDVQNFRLNYDLDFELEDCRPSELVAHCKFKGLILHDNCTFFLTV